MNTLKGQNAVVTGGSRGLGLGIVDALIAQQVNVTVVARNPERLAEISRSLGVEVVCGDITDKELARRVLQKVQPSILVLNAGATPFMGSLPDLTWQDFNRVWDIDVKAGFYWMQEAIRLPLKPGSRVIVGSSGAAIDGSPLSGSYAGAKRMLWLMAGYANGVVKAQGLGINFQAIVPMQIIGETELGHTAAEAYARRRGISTEALLAGFGSPMPPHIVGDNVISILTDPQYETGLAFGMKGDLGIVSLDT